MIIANPIYDVVFKYLLEDIEIARELLSIILEEEIISIELKPQETATESAASSVHILRFDFKAVIKTNTGEFKKILIELQKAKQVFDVMRFRRYLGDNYKKEDDVFAEKGNIEKRPLPIVTIYFLGFSLDNFDNPIVKINREYRDVTTKEVINVKEGFIELLTHDAYIIQIKQLKGKTRTTLERVLQVFSPAYQTHDKHQLEFTGDQSEPLVKKIIDRLGRAIASDEIREKMDVEDEIDKIFERELNKLAQIIAEKEQEIIIEKQKAEAERQNAEAERRNAENEKQKAEAERRNAEIERQKNEDLLKQIAELTKQLKK